MVFLNGPIQASFCLFSFFPFDTIQIQIDKSIDGVLDGTRTRGSRMEGAYKSTELWRHPTKLFTIEGMRQQGGLLRVRLLRGLRAGRQKNLRPSPNARTH